MICLGLVKGLAPYIRNDKKKNRDLVNVIISGLSDLKDEIKKMSQD